MFHLSQTTSFYLPVTKLLNLVEALADHSVQHLYLEPDKLRADVWDIRVLNFSRDRDSVTSLSNPFLCLITFRVNRSFFFSYVLVELPFPSLYCSMMLFLPRDWSMCVLCFFFFPVVPLFLLKSANRVVPRTDGFFSKAVHRELV